MERKVVLYIAVSLDGYIARNNGEVDFLEGDGSDKNGDVGYIDFYNTIDTVIMGNSTYEQIMSWGEYPYKGTEGYVYTNKNIENNEDVIFTNINPRELIKELKKKEGKDIWVVGGAQIAKIFMNENLIDEYITATMPVLIGDGIKLFDKNNEEDIKLGLKESNVVNGIVINKYFKR
ncbi:dihydrofolate reductase family protein [Clostridium butyricum]|jgi:dihydrofolate reductase|uniref:dihydrofolate reductase family protein n=1 Tax=Clostridium butyricum TaxID=1492 RepID=UPI003467598D